MAVFDSEVIGLYSCPNSRGCGSWGCHKRVEVEVWRLHRQSVAAGRRRLTCGMLDEIMIQISCSF